jgi:nicotinamidase-related amidase
MLNPYDHEDGEALAEQVAERIEPIQGLIKATLDSDATLVYANDNYDDFTATSDDLVRNALEGKHPELIKPIAPPDGALFVEKVRHSAFYESSLNHLLHVEEIDRLVLAGQVTEQCILYSALDAYIRGFDIVIAHDAVAPLDPELGDAALRMMERNMSADIVAAADALG